MKKQTNKAFGKPMPKAAIKSIKSIPSKSDSVKMKPIATSKVKSPSKAKQTLKDRIVNKSSNLPPIHMIGAAITAKKVYDVMVDRATGSSGYYETKKRR